MKTAWSKLRLARTKRWFLLISQLLSHHVLSWYHADNCQAVKSMVDAPHYVRTVKRAKQSRKFNRGIKKEMGGPRKVKGHPKRQPCSSSCIAWLCWKEVTKLLMLLNSWSFHFVVLLQLTNLSNFFRELISCKDDGYRWRIWIRHFFSFIRGIFSNLFANLADMQCSIVYEIQEWTNNCLSLCCAMCIASNHSKWRSTRLIF